MPPRLMLILGALLAGLSVAAGAFGAHALRDRLDLNDPAQVRRLEVFETGARYQMVHALALLVVGMWVLKGAPGWGASIAAACFIAGIVLFSGSLYALAITGVRWLGAITPLGGVAFLIGWAALACSFWKSGP